MRYRKLGNRDLMVSEVGMGGEHLEGKPYSQVESTIHAALSGGINVLDIFMSNPDVRTNIGRALKGRRGDMIIQGHIGSAWRNGQYERTRDLSECQHHYHDLLDRLNTDYMDVAMVHYVDTEEDFDLAFKNGLFDYASALKRSGAARAVGVSSHNPLVAKKLVLSGAIDVLMFSVNPAYDVAPADLDLDSLFLPDTFKAQEAFTPAPERAELYRLCEARGVGITVMKGLGAGTLLSAERSPFGAALSTSQLIHYALTRPAVSSILIGFKTPDEVAAALAYESATPAEVDYASVLQSAPKFSMNGRCMYCNHCLPCPSHIDIAAVNKYLDLAELPGDISPTVKAHYLAMGQHGGDCIACGSCESNCPFGVEIIKRMDRAKRLFGT